MLNFKIVDSDEIPLSKRGRKNQEISQHIIEAEIDTWIEISGFDNIKEIISTKNILYSGKRSIVQRMKTQGYKLKTAISEEKLCLYVMKIKI